jgi:AcrR family transcriptional regulator
MAPKSRRKARLPHPSGPAHHSARERILATASELFYQEGSRAVGIDTVIAESGVAKMSLYRSFRSKDELIGAWLEERNRIYWVWFDSIVEQHPGKPREQVRAVIRATAARTVKTGYRGCPFLNTALDYVQARHPGHQLAVRHKQTLASRLLRICRELEARDPTALSRQLVLLINGAQATAGMLGKQTQLELIAAAELLIHAQCSGQSAKPVRRRPAKPRARGISQIRERPPSRRT